MTWIKFHDSLRTNDKRGLSRATRFVFLELALITRTALGTLRLPRNMGDVEAIQDAIGGNPKEVSTAIRELVEGELVEFVGEHPHREMRIPSWLSYNSPDTTTAERQRKHRDQKSRTGHALRNGDVTRDKRTCHVTDVTSVTMLEERRGEEIRKDTRDTKRDACSAPGADSSFSISESQARVLANLEALGAAAAPFAVADTDTVPDTLTADGES